MHISSWSLAPGSCKDRTGVTFWPCMTLEIRKRKPVNIKTILATSELAFVLRLWLKLIIASPFKFIKYYAANLLPALGTKSYHLQEPAIATIEQTNGSVYRFCFHLPPSANTIWDGCIGWWNMLAAILVSCDSKHRII